MSARRAPVRDRVGRAVTRNVCRAAAGCIHHKHVSPWWPELIQGTAVARERDSRAVGRAHRPEVVRRITGGMRNQKTLIGAVSSHGVNTWTPS